MAISTSAINEAIQSIAATGHARVRIGQQEVEVKSIEELLKAVNHLAGTQAAGKEHFGLRFTKLIPPGAG
jgi:hypothetical protein